MTPSDPNQVQEAIRAFIQASINIDGLGNDENLFESGFVNSLFAVQLMTFIERTFQIEVGTDDLDIGNFKSINATAAFVARKVQARAA
jgi:methoxymalonate biosynthesis acyl carrier protein